MILSDFAPPYGVPALTSFRPLGSKYQILKIFNLPQDNRARTVPKVDVAPERML